MARVKRVDNSRKEHTCGRGNHPIPKGDSYYTASPGFRAKPKYRCMEHPFRASELTTSMASEPLAAIEDFTDQVSAGFETHEDLTTAWDDLRSALEQYLEAREEALEQWENGNSQLEELRDTAQEAFDEVEGWEPETFDDDEPEDAESEQWEEWDQDRQNHLSEQASEAESIVGGLSV